MRLLFFVFFISTLCGVQTGLDLFFEEGREQMLAGKKIALVTNQTSINSQFVSSVELFRDKSKPWQLVALFSPEHGIQGESYAWEKVGDSSTRGIPVYSLHGRTRRPTEEMLKGLDAIVYDIQDIGVRCYTYATTLFYVMEEAAKRNIEVIVLDRPNPINGIIVDGTMLDTKWRSYIGYINVPYCHGMTIGELAQFFNGEYKVGCKLSVIPMKGWKRSMSFHDTGLPWIPTSPHIPESDTPLYYATTGILGEISLVNIGVGYSLPFKVVGAEWIDADLFAQKLNEQEFPGVQFIPFHYRPFYGSFKAKNCHGVLIRVTNPITYRPVDVQFALIGILKSLYPEKISEALGKIKGPSKELFCKAVGNDKVFAILTGEKYVLWKLVGLQQAEREEFKRLRTKYLKKEYQ